MSDDNEDDGIRPTITAGMVPGIAALPSSGARAAQRRAILAYLDNCVAGATCEQTATALGMRIQSCSARFSEFETQRRNRNDRTTRDYQRGKSAGVYTPTQFANV